MTDLENSSLADGFRICLLGVESDRRRRTLRFRSVLFDGGRTVGTVEHSGSLLAPDPARLDELRRQLALVAGPPHVLAAHGRGWRDFLRQTLPAYAIAEMRILDLDGTAAALAPGLPARATAERLCREYGIARSDETDPTAPGFREDLLWAVIRRAGELRLDWPGLLAARANAEPAVPFHRYAFNEIGLAALPETPGVYAMRDGDGKVIYAGKAANLRRRLHDYFRASRTLPPKLRAVRERIRDFEHTAAGSEMEALLLENALIARHMPELNVQRTVSEGTSRYARPAAPVAVVAASAAPAAVEVFFLNVRGRALQCRVHPARPPRHALMRLAALSRSAGGDPAFRAPRGVTDWGPAANEICCRYFARFKGKLNWLEADAGASQLRGGSGP